MNKDKTNAPTATKKATTNIAIIGQRVIFSSEAGLIKKGVN